MILGTLYTFQHNLLNIHCHSGGADGQVKRLKAHLVAKNYTQMYTVKEEEKQNMKNDKKHEK